MALLETFGWAMLPPVRPEAIGPRTRAGPDEVQIYRTRGVYRDRESRGKRSTWRPTGSGSRVSSAFEIRKVHTDYTDTNGRHQDTNRTYM